MHGDASNIPCVTHKERLMSTSDDTTILKICRKCSEEKPHTPEYFYRDARQKSGLCATCKKCQDAQKKQWRCENREIVNQRNRNSYYRNIDTRKAGRKRYAIANREGARLRTAQYRERHFDELREKRYNDYHTNKAKYLAHSKKYRDSHREQLRAFWARRRFILRNGGVPFTAEDVRIQFKMQKGNCWWCGNHITDKWEVDHRIAVSRGGMNTNRDIVVACRRCNRSKKDKMPWEWIGRLL
jgi:hypothetical protein